ncbi:MAG TPA: FprA family A-type flavoprotein [Candidatus Fimivicinus intestinavium]|nr:FprA family A-type flavoprotein [Candidatus Fimivicinus intestinavium]
MHCTREVAPHIHWVGGSDRRLALFENMFPLPQGVSYNSYLILDDKIALMDTVDAAITRQFLENIDHVLAGRAIDYLVVNHMEPDHCANIEELARRYPAMKIVGNKKTFQMIRQFYDFSLEERCIEVCEGDTLPLGTHTLQFFFTPMVHWPEVMVAYEQSEGILFSADAFGTFGAHDGALFSDETDFESVYLAEARRYYANIVGKYGPQVQSALKKLAGVEIRMICPLHGPVWREDLGYLLEKYDRWSKYIPEAPGVVLAYASMYGNTENAVDLIAGKLAERGVSNLSVFDVSKTHPSEIIAEMFRLSHIVLASPTYNMGIYYGMNSLLHEMAALNLQNRKAALIGNGSWAPAAAGLMKKQLESMKNMTLLCEPLEIRSALKQEQLPAVDAMVDAICASME